MASFFCWHVSDNSSHSTPGFKTGRTKRRQQDMGNSPKAAPFWLGAKWKLNLEGSPKLRTPRTSRNPLSARKSRPSQVTCPLLQVPQPCSTTKPSVNWRRRRAPLLALVWGTHCSIVVAPHETEQMNLRFVADPICSNHFRVIQTQAGKQGNSNSGSQGNIQRVAHGEVCRDGPLCRILEELPTSKSTLNETERHTFWFGEKPGLRLFLPQSRNWPKPVLLSSSPPPPQVAGVHSR